MALLPSLRLVIYYASKNKKSGLALTSLRIDDAIPSYACTLQRPLVGLVGKGAGVWRTGPPPISVLESVAAWIAVRLCTMCAETGTHDRRPGHTCSAVPDDVTARRPKETKRARGLPCLLGSISGAEDLGRPSTRRPCSKTDRRVHTTNPVWGRCQSGCSVCRPWPVDRERAAGSVPAFRG